MKILVVPDKFKGSLTAREVITGISKGVRNVFPDAEITSVLASDGGDGFLEAISSYVRVTYETVDTFDPLGRPITAPILLDSKTATAYVELAQASGLVILKDREQNPMKTSTYGTGIQLKKAVEMGAKTIYVGLGGSATNDGGLGIAYALGYKFLDSLGKELKPTGENLLKIHSIKKVEVPENVVFYAINDVSNPLYGKDGAAHIYAEQKGATPPQIAVLDQGLRQLDAIVEHQLHQQNATIPGAGAAGGAAYGLKTFCGATFISGVAFVLHLSGVVALLKEEHFDFIVTGEGRIDAQTLQGKLISGVVALGKQFNIPVIGVCGKLDLNPEAQKAFAIDYFIEISQKNKPLSYNMQNAAQLLEGEVTTFFKRYS
ncbi:MAG: glycerate kinase [Bacteroidota bacterium]